MVFEELPAHLPGQLSSDMMERMFDLPDPKYSFESNGPAAHDRLREEPNSGRHSELAVSPGTQRVVDGDSHDSLMSSWPVPGIAHNGLPLSRVHSASLSSNASHGSQRSMSISSNYARHNSVYSEPDDGSAGNSSTIGPNTVDPAMFYSPALGPYNVDGTPLMSPHDAPYQTEVFGDFAIPPAYVESPSNSPSLNPQKRKVKAAGRVAKQSPQLRARIRRSSLTGLSSLPGSANRSAQTSPEKPDGDSPETMLLPGAAAESQSVPSITVGQAVTPATLMGMQFPTTDDPQRQETPQYSVGLERHSSQSSRNSSVHPSPATTPILAPAVQQRKHAAASGVRVTSSAKPARQPTRLRHNSGSAAPISPAMSAKNVQTEQDLASLLASKSNIQGIMEGVHQQMGLQYSDKMTTELSSKKTTHKIAEQERRNRMNSALVELTRLIPNTEAQMSKAATVEAAIEYIRHANARIAELESRLAVYEKPS